MESVAQVLPEIRRRGLRRSLHGLRGAVREMLRWRELLLVLAGRDLKVRYKQSLLGAAWAILQPASMTFIFTVIFGHFVKVPSEGKPYAVFSYAAMLPWSFLAAALGASVSSLVGNLSLVTKVRFPKEILVFAGIGACGVDFLVALCLLPILLLIWQVPLTAAMLWFPLLLVVQITLITGLGLLIAALNVFYRDLRFVVPVGLQLWFFASPVIYPLSAVPEKLRGLYLLNPMAPVLDGYRQALLHGQAPNLAALGMAAVVSGAVLGLGYWAFKRLEPGFADVI